MSWYDYIVMVLLLFLFFIFFNTVQ